MTLPSVRILAAALGGTTIAAALAFSFSSSLVPETFAGSCVPTPEGAIVRPMSGRLGGSLGAWTINGTAVTIDACTVISRAYGTEGFLTDLTAGDTVSTTTYTTRTRSPGAPIVTILRNLSVQYPVELTGSYVGSRSDVMTLGVTRTVLWTVDVIGASYFNAVGQPISSMDLLVNHRIQVTGGVRYNTRRDYVGATRVVDLSIYPKKCVSQFEKRSNPCSSTPQSSPPPSSSTAPPSSFFSSFPTSLPQ